MAGCNGAANQLLLKGDFGPVQLLQAPLGGHQAAGLHELWDRRQPLRQGQLLAVDQVFKEGNVEPLHLQQLGREHRPVQGLLAGQHKAAAQLLELEAMAHGASQGRRLQHLPLNREIQPRRPGHQPPRLAAEAGQGLLQRRTQANRFLQLLGKAIAELFDEIGQQLRAAQFHRQAGGQLAGLAAATGHHAVAVEPQPAGQLTLRRRRLNAQGADVEGPFLAGAGHQPLGQQTRAQHRALHRGLQVRQLIGVITVVADQIPQVGLEQGLGVDQHQLVIAGDQVFVVAVGAAQDVQHRHGAAGVAIEALELGITGAGAMLDPFHEAVAVLAQHRQTAQRRQG